MSFYPLLSLYILFAVLQGAAAWKRRERREGLLSVGMAAVGSVLAVLYHLDKNESFYALGVLERLFHPLTEWIYQIL